MRPAPRVSRARTCAASGCGPCTGTSPPLPVRTNSAASSSDTPASATCAPRARGRASRGRASRFSCALLTLPRCRRSGRRHSAPCTGHTGRRCLQQGGSLVIAASCQQAPRRTSFHPHPAHSGVTRGLLYLTRSEPVGVTSRECKSAHNSAGVRASASPTHHASQQEAEARAAAQPQGACARSGRPRTCFGPKLLLESSLAACRGCGAAGVGSGARSSTLSESAASTSACGASAARLLARPGTRQPQALLSAQTWAVATVAAFKRASLLANSSSASGLPSSSSAVALKRSSTDRAGAWPGGAGGAASCLLRCPPSLRFLSACGAADSGSAKLHAQAAVLCLPVF